jgi:hypothetical protein
MDKDYDLRKLVVVKEMMKSIPKIATFTEDVNEVFTECVDELKKCIEIIILNEVYD